MPAKSKQQWKFMKAVCSGSINKSGLSKKAACEYISSQPTPKGLPKKKKKKR